MIKLVKDGQVVAKSAEDNLPALYYLMQESPKGEYEFVFSVSIVQAILNLSDRIIVHKIQGN